MKGTITKVEEKKSYMGDKFWYVFFKMEDGKSARTCVYSKYGNAARWMPTINEWLRLRTAIVLDGLILKGRMVDADSFFSVVK